jgi:hypothetical protein
MSNTITAEEYRRMIGKKEPANEFIDTIKAAAKVAKNAKAAAEKIKPEPSGKSGKMDTVAALKAMGNYFELDPKSVNFVISQWKISGKI